MRVKIVYLIESACLDVNLEGKVAFESGGCIEFKVKLRYLDYSDFSGILCPFKCYLKFYAKFVIERPLPSCVVKNMSVQLSLSQLPMTGRYPLFSNKGVHAVILRNLTKMVEVLN